MAGVISVIQLIHYPSFVHISRDQFLGFHSQHSKALGLIAGPMMCIELFSALWLAKNGNVFFIANLICVVSLWCLTFFISVPAHHQLAAGFNEKAWSRLVKTNWLRTLLWCIRAIVFSVSFIFINRVS